MCLDVKFMLGQRNTKTVSRPWLWKYWVQLLTNRFTRYFISFSSSTKSGLSKKPYSQWRFGTSGKKYISFSFILVARKVLQCDHIEESVEY